MRHVVLEHHHDKHEGVYRLVVAREEMAEVVAVDEDGNPKTRVVDEETGATEPVLEQVPVHSNVEDFVFAADDERWQGKTKEQVAKAQRKLVRAALEERQGVIDAEARRVTAARSALPGTGEAL